MAITQRISPCLWFADEAEEAARFYTSVFPNSRIKSVMRYSSEGQEVHQRPPGSVMVVVFDLDGQEFSALNGGPLFRFTEAVSLQVFCESQEEIDHYWDTLSAGGDPAAQQCGWLKDRYGLSWQVVPAEMNAMFTDAESPATRAVMAAMLQMKKLDMNALREAYATAAA